MDHGDCMNISMKLSNLNMATWGVSSRCRTTPGGDENPWLFNLQSRILEVEPKD